MLLNELLSKYGRDNLKEKFLAYYTEAISWWDSYEIRRCFILWTGNEDDPASA